MTLWLEWFRCVLDLRPACSRARTFLWMSLALLGLSVRAELGGVTSFVRAGGLAADTYPKLLICSTARAWRWTGLRSAGSA